MTAKEFRATFEGKELTNVDGENYQIDFDPPMTEQEITNVQSRFKLPFPTDLLEAMAVFSGFQGQGIGIAFKDELYFQDEELCKHAYPFGPDGMGNTLIIDLPTSSTNLSHVMWWCHDPPIIGEQCMGLDALWDQFVQWETGPEQDCDRSDVDMKIYRSKENFIPQSQALQSADGSMRAFAESLSGEWSIIDLRKAKFGDGFCWDNAGKDLELRRRFGDELLFAVVQKGSQKQKGWLQKLFGK